MIELKLSGNLLMVDPWMVELEPGLEYSRRDFVPGSRKPKITRHKLYHTQNIDNRTVGYVPDAFLDRIGGQLTSAGYKVCITDERKWKTLPEPDLSKADLDSFRAGQMEALAAVVDNVCGVVVAPTSFGKCLGRGERVILYDGSVRPVEEIKTGDVLLGPDSKPRRVMGTVRGNEPLYRVSPIKGSPFTATGDHILYLRDTVTKRDKELTIKSWLASSKTFRHCHKLVRSSPVSFNQNNELSMDPYLLGLWIGDGTRSQPAITTMDSEVVDYLKKSASDMGVSLDIRHKPGGKASTYAFSAVAAGKLCRRGNNPMINSLRSLSLYKCAVKRIPTEYLTASLSDRRELLAGIIDSDGFHIKSCYEIICKDRSLAEQMIFLARSLGKAAYMSIKSVRLKSWEESRSYFRVLLSGNFEDIPIKVAHKKPYKRKTKKDALVVGFKVEEIGCGDFFGFELDGDHKFLLGDFTITHNSHLLIQIARVYPGLRIVIATARKPVVDTIHERALKDPLLAGRVRHVHSNGPARPKEVVISTLKSLRKCSPEKCDLLLVDECHNAPAAGYASDIAEFRDARRFGFTASPIGRSDGCDLVVESLLGPVRFEQTYQASVEAGAINQIDVLVRKVRCKPVEAKTKVARLRWNVWRNNTRNRMIAEDARALATQGQVLVMCATVDHVLHLKKRLPEFEVVFSLASCPPDRWANYVRNGFTTDPYPTRQDMDGRRNRFESGELRGALCTFVWSEGVSFDGLSGLIRADAGSGEIRSTQIPGRLSRICEGKEKAWLVDYDDIFEDTLRQASNARFASYKKKGWVLHHVD